jgi:prevent-host-death family protein
MDKPLIFSDGASISAESAGEPFGSAIAHAAEDKVRLVLTRDGKRVAAIVPIEDYDALEAAEDAEDERLAAEALAEWEAAGRPPGIPMDEVARELGIDLSALQPWLGRLSLNPPPGGNCAAWIGTCRNAS